MMRHRKAPPFAAQALAAMAAAALAWPAAAQSLPVTPGQRATAQQVAQAGVPLAELAPNAPDSYTVKSGDTLWAISKMYLTTPWRWPELWGMNLQDIKNPHRIFPGQVLVLEKANGRARLRVQQAQGDAPPTETVRVSPRVRYTALADTSIPMINPGVIEPFLAEPVIVEEGTLRRAPRIVAGPEERVLLGRGDRVYARGSDGTPLALTPGKSDEFRVFRNAKPLRDPITKAVLGYEAEYLGQATLLRAEGVENTGGKSVTIPATLELVSARSEMQIGDRLLPEPGRQLVSYAPRAPEQTVDAAIVSIYGDAVGLAGQNQVVVINKGTADGVESGHVLALQKAGARLVDKSQPGERSEMKLPDERNGLLMVFRPFERLSYALILETNTGARVGDRATNPR